MYKFTSSSFQLKQYLLLIELMLLTGCFKDRESDRFFLDLLFDILRPR